MARMNGSGRAPVVGVTIQAKPTFCPHCDGRKLTKRGLRKNCFRQLQIYVCGDCNKYFSSLAGLKGVKYPPRLIARALCLYHLGHSHGETVKRIAKEHHLTVPRRTVSGWIAGYRSITTFHRLRTDAVAQFPHGMLKQRTLVHQQVYQYKVHRAKLALMPSAVPYNVAAKTERYLLSVFENFPDGLFQEDQPRRSENRLAPAPAALRSSESRFETLPFARSEKQNLANDLAALGLLLAQKNRDRHAGVQDFMLANDSVTVACEVPVYLTADELRYYKSKGFFVALPETSKPITGHIDVLQARNGFLHLLDYKPKARDIDPVNQLVVYALAFASRTRLPVRVFKCAWFDEKDYFEFFPLQAIKAKATQASKGGIGPE